MLILYCALGGFLVAAVVSSLFFRGWFEPIWFGTVAAMCSAMLSMPAALALPQDLVGGGELKSSEPIISLSDSTILLLGRGYVGVGVVYTYYTDEDGALRYHEVAAEQCEIVESDAEQPRVEIYGPAYESAVLNHLLITSAGRDKYRFYIHEGQFKVDITGGNYDL